MRIGPDYASSSCSKHGWFGDGYTRCPLCAKDKTLAADDATRILIAALTNWQHTGGSTEALLALMDARYAPKVHWHHD